jgi:hypothetical protein
LAFHSGREADHSPPSSAEVKEWVEFCLHSPNAPSWRGARLGEHKSNFTICTRMYPKVSGLAAWSENCKWYSSLPLSAVVSLFFESV